MMFLKDRRGHHSAYLDSMCKSACLGCIRWYASSHFHDHDQVLEQTIFYPAGKVCNFHCNLFQDSQLAVFPHLKLVIPWAVKATKENANPALAADQ
jgi:hypothetical protein